ncbi:unnamed protein product [Linum tenue]|uniref:Uncharacterized protein n=1 Tax=Linum tenue TaxID=586396 RepID=A0AAV0RJB4_9ROSI|nr:unnamed protein product [Linum tenue]
MRNGSESEDTLLCGSWIRTVSAAEREKKPVPWKTSLGIPNLAAAAVDQGKNMSATRQSGLEDSRRLSRGPRSEAVARKNFGASSAASGREVMESMFSQLGGRPESPAAGKAMVVVSRFGVAAAAGAKNGWLRSVVTMVDLMPLVAKSLAMWRNGIMWPRAMNGKKKMCSCWK